MITAFFDGVYLFMASDLLSEFFAMVAVAGSILMARKLFRREV